MLDYKFIYIYIYIYIYLCVCVFLLIVGNKTWIPQMKEEFTFLIVIENLPKIFLSSPTLLTL